jgi:excisionase family DNA binding protein
VRTQSIESVAALPTASLHIQRLLWSRQLKRSSGRTQSEAVVQLGLAAGSNAAEAAVHLDRPYHLIATMTMSEAAAKLGVNNRRIRRLIKEGLLSAEQVVARAPYQIRASDLLDQRVIDAVGRTDRPCHAFSENQISMFSIT